MVDLPSGEKIDVIPATSPSTHASRMGSAGSRWAAAPNTSTIGANDVAGS
jgi:hypothetical protein